MVFREGKVGIVIVVGVCVVVVVVVVIPVWLAFTGLSQKELLWRELQCQVAAREAGYLDYVILEKGLEECVIGAPSGVEVTLQTDSLE